MAPSEEFLVCLLLIAGLLISGECRKKTKVGRGQKKSHNSSRVIGGYLSDISYYPFLVSLQLSLRGSWIHNCGGSIVSPRAVLTTAHCLIDWSPSDYRCVAGVTDWRDLQNAQVRYVLDFDIHPGYGGKYNGFVSDAGVMILDAPYQWTGTVRPLAVPSYDRGQAKSILWNMEASNVRCDSPGWGKVNKGPYQPHNTLKSTPSILMSSRQCARTFCRLRDSNCDSDFFGLDQLCASSSAGIPCNGDSGGPLVCNGMVVGLVGWYYDCIIGWPHVYTDIGPILDVALKYM